MSERRAAQGPQHAESNERGVTVASGFSAGAAYCGIRKAEIPDVALVVSDRPASAAAVFTTNLVQAAPIAACRESLAATASRARAILVNAGNANACTGPQGLAAARRSAAEAAKLLDVPPAEVLVSSTGVIGQQLPVEKLVAGLPQVVAALSPSGGAAAARAIMTTDTRSKQSVRRVTTARGSYVVGGMAKGSGMIHPNMATTLAFVTTDAALSPQLLQASLSRANEVSFNRISVDGDTSTNDMVAVLANGASGVDASADLASFEAALTGVLTDLAIDVARDGEGATKLVTVEVTGARSEADALQVSRTIAGSPLVKTAIHGADANWGRIVAAAGRAGVALDPARLRVALSGVEVLAPGYQSSFSEDAAREVLLRDEVTVSVDLGAGTASARTWTCDLSAEYVAINGSYRS
jgi:glutamate N-acetyltransferase/amino-acid N-acetyltransferase